LPYNKRLFVDLLAFLQKILYLSAGVFGKYSRHTYIYYKTVSQGISIVDIFVGKARTFIFQTSGSPCSASRVKFFVIQNEKQTLDKNPIYISSVQIIIVI